jgi:hypothetical protein
VKQHDRALALWESALEFEFLNGRRWALNVIAVGARSLAAVDDGKSLWDLFQSFAQVENWWKATEQ